MFERMSKWIAAWTGHGAAFSIALVCIIGWLCSGPWLGWSDTWQLIVNTSTTIITFLMVFVIQAAQNRDTKTIEALLTENNRLLKELIER